MASTAMRGFTLSSSASRQASTASSRCSTPSGVSARASRRTSAVASGCGGADGRAALRDQDVPVERREVDQRPVERVALGAGGAGPLPALQLLDRAGAAAGGGRRALAGPAGAEGLLERLRLRAVQLRGQRGGLLLGGLTSWSAAAKQAPRSVSEAGTDSTALRRSRASASRASRRARPTWPCAACAAQSAVVVVDPVAPDEHVSDRLRRWRAERDDPAPGADGDRHVVGMGGGRAEQEHRPAAAAPPPP